MKPTHQPTDAEMVVAITKSALAAGFDTSEIRGLLLAERTNGILRPNCPLWLRAAQYFVADHGRLYPLADIARASADFLEVLEIPESPAPQTPSACHRGDAG
jgi:hypothetical protein